MNKSLIFALLVGMMVLSTSGWAYEFGEDKELVNSYDVNNSMIGVTSDGTYLWITDGTDDKVYKYFSNGTYAGTNFVTTGSGGTNPSAINYIDNNFYISDKDKETVYKYYYNGTYTGTLINLTIISKTDPAGVVSDGTYLWILSGSSEIVYKYYYNGTYTGTQKDIFNDSPRQIGTFNEYFLITDIDNNVYRYHNNFTFYDTYLSNVGDTPYGITFLNNYIYVIDANTDKLKKYSYNPYNLSSETLSYDTNISWFDTNTIASTLVYDTDYSNISAKLEYNGTNYTMARSGGVGTYVFSYNKNFATATSGNKNFKIFYDVTYLGSTTTYTGDTYTQTVNSPALYVCNATYTTHAVDFFIYDEVDKTDKIAKLEGTFLVYGNNISNNATYNFTFTGDNNYSLCITPTNEQFYTIAQLQYYNKTTTVYNDRSYFLYNSSISNSSTQLNLYLSNNTSQIFFNVPDEFGNPYINAIIKAQRYYLAEDVYRTITMSKTDDNGDTFMYLMPNTIWYRFVVEKDGEILKTFTPMLLTSNDVSLPVATIEPSNLFEYWDTIGYSCSFSNVTNYLTCIVSDTSGKLTLSTLLVYDTTSGGETLVCNETSVSNSVTLYCELPDVTNKQYSYNLYGNFCCSTETIYSMTNGVLDFFDGVGVGTMGMFVTLLIILVLAGIGIFNPAVAITLTIIGLFAMSTIGFLDTTTSAIVGIAVVGIIIISKMGV